MLIVLVRVRDGKNGRFCIRVETFLKYPILIHLILC